jgi:hypothetical protein
VVIPPGRRRRARPGFPGRRRPVGRRRSRRRAGLSDGATVARAGDGRAGHEGDADGWFAPRPPPLGQHSRATAAATRPDRRFRQVTSSARGRKGTHKGEPTRLNRCFPCGGAAASSHPLATPLCDKEQRRRRALPAAARSRRARATAPAASAARAARAVQADERPIRPGRGRARERAVIVGITLLLLDW